MSVPYNAACCFQKRRLQLLDPVAVAMKHSMSRSASDQCGVIDFHGCVREAVLVCAAVASH